MSVHTVCAYRVQGCAADSAENILARSDGLQMIWVDAGTVAAQVIEHQAIANRAYQNLVTGSMGPALVPTAIAVHRGGCTPQPTPGVRLREHFVPIPLWQSRIQILNLGHHAHLSGSPITGSRPARLRSGVYAAGSSTGACWSRLSNDGSAGISIARSARIRSTSSLIWSSSQSGWIVFTRTQMDAA